MKVTTEKEIRESISRQIKSLTKKAASLIKEEKAPDQDFDPTKLQGIPKNLTKLLDPDITPQKFAKLDAQLDEKGSVEHQAFALLAFALTYSDKDVKAAQTLLKKAMSLAPKVEAMMKKAGESPSDNPTESGEEESDFKWKG